MEKDYYLISTTLKVGKLRQYFDIPVFIEKGMFPDRLTLFKFACDRARIELEEITDEIFSTFAVISVFKFDTEEQFNQFNVSPQNEPIDDDEE